ncbi:hypothetical protein FQN57_002130 [Myotisia sp. PD_48]|nr:hypothetical protein FQN57_002130 [Myotisia sp. PD_48]
MSVLRFFILGLAATTSINAAAAPSCRVLPGDSAWPKVADWERLNRTVNGRLTASVPAASVCHDAPFNNYNAEECSAIQETWRQTRLSHIDQPAEFMSMYFNNYTCDAFTPRSKPCELGNYASYVIEVTGAADVRAGVNFARKNNVRLVIKNTGHDYLGKSTGKGGLTLWTHNLKSSEYIPNYSASYYKGPAFKFGAGVMGFEAVTAANATGNRMVTGGCPTVGVAGGYSQGGGHSILSSMYGLGADNVLEWEVVTLDGRHLVATPNKNQDLYWAISGGGGGNYAIVLSMTARAHRDSIIGSASLSFNDTKVGNDAFWDAVGAFHTLLPPFVDAGNSATYALTNNVFLTWGVIMPGADVAEVRVLMKPFLDDLEKRGIDYEFTPRSFPNYYEHFDFHVGPLPEGFAGFAPFTSSRILPRSMFVDPEQNPIVTDALRRASQTANMGYDPPMACQSLNVSHQAHSDNAVHPAWRDALTVCLFIGQWDPRATPAEMAERQNFAANVLQPMIDDATPGGGVYLNEANYQQRNWQKEFYGSNYPRLLRVKKKYDPEHLLYARTAPGSEAWAEDGNGRLCRT